MTLVPLIVAVCLNVQDPEYQEACEAALNQAAKQTDIAVKFENYTKRLERKVKELVVLDNQTTAIIFSIAGFTYRLTSNKESTLSVKVAPSLTSQIKFNQEFVMLGVTYDF